MFARSGPIYWACQYTTVQCSPSQNNSLLWGSWNAIFICTFMYCYAKTWCCLNICSELLEDYFHSHSLYTCVTQMPFLLFAFRMCFCYSTGCTGFPQKPEIHPSQISVSINAFLCPVANVHVIVNDASVITATDLWYYSLLLKLQVVQCYFVFGYNQVGNLHGNLHMLLYQSSP